MQQPMIIEDTWILNDRLLNRTKAFLCINWCFTLKATFQSSGAICVEYVDNSQCYICTVYSVNQCDVFPGLQVAEHTLTEGMSTRLHRDRCPIFSAH